jgi:hypothetical protein
LGILAWQESAKDNVVNASKIKKEISDFLGDKDWERDFPDNPKEIEKIVWEAEKHYGGSKDISKDVEELKGRFLAEEIKERLSRAGGDPNTVSNLLAKKKKLDHQAPLS